jgi:hypothetical protein
MYRPLFVASLAVLVAGCEFVELEPPVVPPDECPVIETRNWSAFVNAMPGPGARPELIVSGQVRVPSAGYSVELVAGWTDRSLPPVQTVELIALPPFGPAAQVVTAMDVRLAMPAPATRPGGAAPFRAVRVVCGEAELAYISPVEVAW